MDLSSMMGKMQEMQANMQKTKEQLNDLIVESDAGGGMVKVSMNGNKQLLKLFIDPDILNDKEMMEDLVCAAVNNAIIKAEEASKTAMADAAKGMIPDIPGLDLGSMGL